MMDALQIINALLLTVIILCAVDASRVTSLEDGYWRAFANCMVALGALGCLFWNSPRTYEDALFQVVLNAGIAVLCIRYLRRQLARSQRRPSPWSIPHAHRH